MAIEASASWVAVAGGMRGRRCEREGGRGRGAQGSHFKRERGERLPPSLPLLSLCPLHHTRPGTRCRTSRWDDRRYGCIRTARARDGDRRSEEEGDLVPTSPKIENAPTARATTSTAPKPSATRGPHAWRAIKMGGPRGAAGGGGAGLEGKRGRCFQANAESFFFFADGSLSSRRGARACAGVSICVCMCVSPTPVSNNQGDGGGTTCVKRADRGAAQRVFISGEPTAAASTAAAVSFRDARARLR